MNKKYYYMKLKEDFFDQDEIIFLEQGNDGVIYSNILLKMYLKSLKGNGYLEVNGIPMTPEMIASLTRQQVGTVEMAIERAIVLGLVEQTESGILYMSHIEEMVGSSSTEAERKARSRRIASGKDSRYIIGNNVDICPNIVRNLSEKCTTENRDKSIDYKDYRIESAITLPHKAGEVEKSFYGKYQNVLLSDKEYQQLVADYPDEYHSMIDHMSEYMASSGKMYANHFATMIMWKNADEQKSKKCSGYSYDIEVKEGDSL